MTISTRNSEEAPRPVRGSRLTHVVSTEDLSPQMVRIVLGGEDLEDFSPDESTDAYVKLQFPAPGASYSAPFTIEEIRAERPKAEWPRVRTYTVAGWDPDALELTIDFVCHGDDGVAGPWARTARPGDSLQLTGPGGGYSPDPAARSHLMIGDLCVVPAIEAALLRVHPGTPVRAMIEVDGPDEERKLESPGQLELSWHYGAGAEESPLLAALEDFDTEGTEAQLFVHGEAGMVREVRRRLVVERGLRRSPDLSISGYWKRRRTEEGWREDKPEWKRLVAADEGGSGV